MFDFSQRFVIIYEKFSSWAQAEDRKSSKLAFARFLGVSQGAIQNWEKGTLPSPKDMKTIHDKLGFAYDWLIAGEGEVFDKKADVVADSDLQARVAELEATVKQLTTRLLVDGVGDKNGSIAIGKAADGQG